MKKMKQAKLVLASETVNVLTAARLVRAQGGDSIILATMFGCLPRTEDVTKDCPWS